MRPERGRGKLVFINLQKRLLSSVEAFRRTLEVHAASVAAGRARTALQLDLTAAATDDDDAYGPDDDAAEAADADAVAAASATLASPAGRAAELLAEMRSLAAQHATAPDAKVAALLDWIRAHQCPAVAVGGATGTKAERKWTDTRVIVFTEYGDTKRYLHQLLSTAVEGSHLGDERILAFHGGMSDDQRAEVQRAFNGPPADHPVRILIATDAAREGVNLQGHCADLFHQDVPWNPARMEQRNGRIDRTLQPAPEVRCHYFYYPDRAEDVVLNKLVAKVDTISAELGSLGAVVMAQLADVLDRGIDATTGAAIESATATSAVRARVTDELESQRELKRLKADIDDNARIAAGSRKLLDFEPAQLRQVIDVGLALAGAGPLTRVAGADTETPDDDAYALPPLGDSWHRTLDTLRRPRAKDESVWEWRDAAPPQPVVFQPPPRLAAEVAQLHLSHPFVQRILARFRAQGFSAQDLTRVTALRNPHGDQVVAIAFGRLSLFGAGASRLHDQLIAVAAHWEASGGPGHRAPLDDKADAAAQEMLHRVLRELRADTKPVAKQVAATLAAAAPEDFAALWPEIQVEADAVAHEAGAKLDARARAESAALTRLLEEQRAAIGAELARRRQLGFEWSDAERDQRDQYEADEAHMAARLAAIDRELDTEPAQIRSLYQVALRRLEPVGLVYLWPATR